MRSGVLDPCIKQALVLGHPQRMSITSQAFLGEAALNREGNPQGKGPAANPHSLRGAGGLAGKGALGGTPTSPMTPTQLQPGLSDAEGVPSGPGTSQAAASFLLHPKHTWTPQVCFFLSFLVCTLGTRLRPSLARA